MSGSVQVQHPRTNRGSSPIPQGVLLGDDEDTKPVRTISGCDTRESAMTTTETSRETKVRRDRWSPSLADWPRRWIRIVLGLIAAYVGGHAAFIVLFIGSVVTTGCFFECSGPNPLAGVPILVLSAALLTLTLGALWWAFVDRYWKVALRTLAIIGATVAVGLVIWIATPA